MDKEKDTLVERLLKAYENQRKRRKKAKKPPEKDKHGVHRPIAVGHVRG